MHARANKRSCWLSKCLTPKAYTPKFAKKRNGGNGFYGLLSLQETQVGLFRKDTWDFRKTIRRKCEMMFAKIWVDFLSFSGPQRGKIMELHFPAVAAFSQIRGAGRGVVKMHLLNLKCHNLYDNAGLWVNPHIRLYLPSLTIFRMRTLRLRDVECLTQTSPLVGAELSCSGSFPPGHPTQTGAPGMTA